MNPHELQVLLYSASQGAFHVETLAQTIASGVKAYAAQRPHDYVLLGIAETRAEIDVIHAELVAQFGRHAPTKTP